MSKPPLHRRVKMCLLYDGFFSFAVGRGRFSLYIKIKKEPIITSKLTLCITGSASVRLALG